MPEAALLAAFPVLTRLGLGVFGILQSVAAVGDADVVHVHCELLGFSEVEEALVGAAPIAAEVGLVFVVPDEPATALEESGSREFQVGQDFGEAADVERAGGLEDAGGLLDPLEGPADLLLLRLKGVPLGLFDAVGRVEKGQVGGLGRQRAEPGDGVAKPYLAVRVCVVDAGRLRSMRQ